MPDEGTCESSALAAPWRRLMTLYGLDPVKHGQVETVTEQQLHEARQAMEPLKRSAGSGAASS